MNERIVARAAHNRSLIRIIERFTIHSTKGKREHIRDVNISVEDFYLYIYSFIL